MTSKLRNVAIGPTLSCGSSPLSASSVEVSGKLVAPVNNAAGNVVIVKFQEVEGFMSDEQEEVAITPDMKSCDITAKALKQHFSKHDLESHSPSDYDLWQAAEKDGSAPYPLSGTETPMFTIDRHGNVFVLKARVELEFEKPGSGAQNSNSTSPTNGSRQRRMSQGNVHANQRSNWGIGSSSRSMRTMMGFMSKKDIKQSSSRPQGDNKSIASGSTLSGDIEEFDVGEIINCNADVWMEEKNGKTVIRAAANVDVIINKISELGVTDTEFFDMFLVTFRHIITPMDLLQKLIQRTLIADDNLSRDSSNSMTIQMGANQIRAINFILKWIQSAWFDFECAEIQDALFGLINRMRAAGVDTVSTRLEGALGSSISAGAKHRMPCRQKQIMDIAQLGNQDTVFYKFNVQEVAVALTNRESTLFRKVIPQSLVIDMWGNVEDKKTTCKPLLEHTAWFNNISEWVCTEICIIQDLQLRTFVIDMFLRIAKHLRNMRNFNTAYAVLLGLNSGPVQRLKRSWEGLSAEKIDQMQKMEVLFSPMSNFRNYRKKLKHVLDMSPDIGAIPILSIMTKDLIAMNEIPIKLENGYVNLHKLRLMAIVINQVARLQELPLESADVVVDDTVRLYIEEMPTAPYMLRYNLSYLAEPRKGNLSLKDKMDLITALHHNIESPHMLLANSVSAVAISTKLSQNESHCNSSSRPVSSLPSDVAGSMSPQVKATDDAGKQDNIPTAEKFNLFDMLSMSPTGTESDIEPPCRDQPATTLSSIVMNMPSDSQTKEKADGNERSRTKSPMPDSSVHSTSSDRSTTASLDLFDMLSGEPPSSHTTTVKPVLQLEPQNPVRSWPAKTRSATIPLTDHAPRGLSYPLKKMVRKKSDSEVTSRTTESASIGKASTDIVPKTSTSAQPEGQVGELSAVPLTNNHATSRFSKKKNKDKNPKNEDMISFLDML
eukprot:CFRG3568T1